MANNLQVLLQKFAKILLNKATAGNCRWVVNVNVLLTNHVKASSLSTLWFQFQESLIFFFLRPQSANKDIQHSK